MSFLDATPQDNQEKSTATAPLAGGSLLDTENQNANKSFLDGSNTTQEQNQVRTYPGAGGAYNSSTNTPETPLITSSRGYANLVPETGMQRDHIIPVALGGASVPSNLRYQPADQAAYKDNVEKYLIDQVKTGQMDLPTARAKVLNWDNIEVPTTAKDYKQQGAYNMKDFTGLGSVKTFLSGIPDTLQRFFSGTSVGIQDIIHDPFNIAPSTKGGGMTQFGKDFYNATVGTVISAGADELHRAGDFLNSIKSNAPTSEKIATGIKTVSGLANVAFSPISAVFKGAEQFPVLGTIAKAIALPFTGLADAGSHTAITALDQLPLKDSTKQNLRDAIGEISGIAFQLIGGGVIGDILTPDKLGELKAKFGTEGANQIIDAAKEKANVDVTKTETPKEIAKPQEVSTEPIKETPKEVPQEASINKENPEIPKENTPIGGQETNNIAELSKVAKENPGEATPKEITPEEQARMQAGFVNPTAAFEAGKQALERYKTGQENVKFGEALRTFFTGERDYRVTETNQLRDVLRKVVPNTVDQEALTIARDFKNNTTALENKLEQYKESTDPNLKRLVPVIEKALNPTEHMKIADKAITNYFTEKLDEGQRLGFLDSTISPDQYITHLFQKAQEEGDMTKKSPGLFGSKIGRNFKFSKSRFYENTLDAIEHGVKPRTMNAFDALTIYGEKHATAAATRILVQELKDSDIGKWGFRTSGDVPRGWVELAPGRELFRNRIPFVNEEGKPSIATQNLYVPPKVAEALRPIIEPSSVSNLPGFRAGRLYQSYIKSAELGLSAFHMKALNFTALNNESLNGIVKSYGSDITSPEFLETEKSFVKAGGTSPILGRTIEAYQGLKDTSLPTRMDLLKGLPGVKQIDTFAKGLTHVTFDIMQRKFKVTDFALKDAEWIAKNPQATEAEHFDAQKSIAKEINATYGGLQWENLGVSKGLLDLAKFLILAPDWTFSNFLNAKYAFDGGQAGKAARAFWIRSVITGTALNEGMSLLMSGKTSSDPTQVYLGKDKNGKDIYTNFFFVGANNDLINLWKDISDQGLPNGVGHWLSTKASPYLRAGTELFTNENYLHQPIVPKGAGPVVGTALGAANLAKNLSPVPFTLQNIYNMATDPKHQYSWKEFLTILGGNVPRHVVPAGEREVTSGKNKGKLIPATPKQKLPLLEQIKTGKVYQSKKK